MLFVLFTTVHICISCVTEPLYVFVTFVYREFGEFEVYLIFWVQGSMDWFDCCYQWLKILLDVHEEGIVAVSILKCINLAR